MTYRGHVENGVVLLDEGTKLPEGVEVRIEIVQSLDAKEDEGPTLYDRLKPLIGVARDLPPDLATNHGHYLYGQPKK